MRSFPILSHRLVHTSLLLIVVLAAISCSEPSLPPAATKPAVTDIRRAIAVNHNELIVGYLDPTEPYIGLRKDNQDYPIAGSRQVTAFKLASYGDMAAFGTMDGMVGYVKLPGEKVTTESRITFQSVANASITAVWCQWSTIDGPEMLAGTVDGDVYFLDDRGKQAHLCTLPRRVLWVGLFDSHIPLAIVEGGDCYALSVTEKAKKLEPLFKVDELKNTKDANLQNVSVAGQFLYVAGGGLFSSYSFKKRSYQQSEGGIKDGTLLESALHAKVVLKHPNGTWDEKPLAHN